MFLEWTCLDPPCPGKTLRSREVYGGLVVVEVGEVSVPGLSEVVCVVTAWEGPAGKSEFPRFDDVKVPKRWR